MKNNTFDIIIGGGGPAGLYASYQLQKMGFKTLVLEKDRIIGEPILCAEAVSNRTIELFLGSLPENAVRNRFNNLILHYNEKFSQTAIPDMGLILNRAVFDRYIAKLAEREGALIRTGEAITDAEYGDSGVSVSTDICQYKCKVFIAADGVESQCAAYMNINTNVQLSDIYSCYEVVARHPLIDRDNIEFDFSYIRKCMGYVWVFPRGDNEANIGLGIVKKDACNTKKMLYSYLESRFKGAEILENKAGAVPVNPLKKPFADRVLIIGDAGRFADPMTGGGIDNALRTAKWASIVINEAFKHNDFTEHQFCRFLNYIENDNMYSLKMQMKLKYVIEQLTVREHTEFFESIIGLLDHNEILSDYFYNSFNNMRNKSRRAVELLMLLKGIAYKKTMIKILYKLLWA